MDLFRKRYGTRFDAEERKRKKEARHHRVISRKAKTTRGIKAKIFNEKRRKEKIQLQKLIRSQEEMKKTKEVKQNDSQPLPAYLLDRKDTIRSRVLAAAAKQRSAQRASKYSLPIEKVQPQTEADIFRVLKTGKRRSKEWKRLVTQPVFIPPNYTRKNPKLERFIRPAALRYNQANVTHPELGVTVKLDILSVKKNPSGNLMTGLGVLSKGTVIEVNTAGLGAVTESGKIVWGKYAQITNNVERDGCVNAILLS